MKKNNNYKLQYTIFQILAALLGFILAGLYAAGRYACIHWNNVLMYALAGGFIFWILSFIGKGKVFSYILNVIQPRLFFQTGSKFEPATTKQWKKLAAFFFVIGIFSLCQKYILGQDTANMSMPILWFGLVACGVVAAVCIGNIFPKLSLFLAVSLGMFGLGLLCLMLF